MQRQFSLKIVDRVYETLLVRGEPLSVVEAGRLLLSSPFAPEDFCRKVVSVLVSLDRRFCWDRDTGQALSLRQWVMPDPHLTEVAFVALDLETTGARPGLCKITEIGAVRLEGFREVRRFNTLVNPMRPIPPFITRITGITQKMVADAPRIEEVLPELLAFLEGTVIVAHNAPFDVGFLNYELSRLAGWRLGEGAIDTLPLARAVAPGLPNYRLGTIAEAFGAPVAACHRALADAQAVSHVFVTLAERLHKQGVNRLSELRALISPAARLTLEKLPLTRDLPRRPGIYRLVGSGGTVLYIGKADSLGDKVRSHFFPGANLNRPMRQALSRVEQIEWEETVTPLEAVVQEQNLILKYSPLCNTHALRPEAYVYLKASGGKAGLRLSVSRRTPRWLSTDESRRPARDGLVLGPFRSGNRLRMALELLHQCFPIRDCFHRPAKHPTAQPCERAARQLCLAPCMGDPEAKERHDELVRQILLWLSGCDVPDLPDPLEQAERLARQLRKRRREEQAQKITTAAEILCVLRKSCLSLAEARGLRFATLWPCDNNGNGPALRLNLVWNGLLREPAWLHPRTVADDLETALAPLWKEQTQKENTSSPCSLVVVPREQLDILLAIRRWFYEAKNVPKFTLPAPGTNRAAWETFKAQLLAQAGSMLSG